MLPTGSWTVAVWPAATPLKFGVVTRFRMSLPRVAALRRAQEARAAELAQQEAGDDHPDDHGDGRHGDLFDVHGKGAPSWLPAMQQPGDLRRLTTARWSEAARAGSQRATRKSVSYVSRLRGVATSPASSPKGDFPRAWR